MSSKPKGPVTSAVLSPAEAITLFESAVKSEPTAPNYLELGAAYYVAHRWDDALSTFEKTIQLDPRQAYAYYYLGVLYAAKGMRDKANDALNHLLQTTTNQMLKEQAQTRIPNVNSEADLSSN